MKVWEKIILPFVVLSLLLSSFPTVFALEAGHKVSPITYTDGENPLECLLPNETVLANVTASGFAEGERAIFILTLYRENKMLDIAADAKAFPAGGSASFSVSLNMPDDIKGCSLKAVLWDGLEQIRPLSSAGLFPSGDAALKYIMLDGTLLQDFTMDTKEYDHSVSDFASISPAVQAPAMDGTTSVTVKTTKEFPGKSMITVTAQDGTQTSYTVNFKSEGTQDTFVSDFQASNGSDLLSFGLKNGAQAFAEDPNTTYENLIEELDGAVYVTAASDFSSDSEWTGANKDWYTFQLNRSAAVMLVSDREIDKLSAEQSGWTLEQKTAAQRYQKVDPSNAGYGVYKDLSYVYSKQVSVTGDPVEVKIPNAGLEASPYLTAVRFTYDEVCGSLLEEPESPVSALKYLGPTNENGVIFNGQPVMGNNFQNGTRLYTNYNNLVCADLAPELEGLTSISIPSPIAGTAPAFVKNAWGGSRGIDWTEFTLSKSAVVRVFAQGTINALTWPVYGYTMETASNGCYFSRLNTDWPNAERSKMDRMYSKYVEVQEGGTAKVKLPNAPFTNTSKWGYVVLVDFEGAPPPPPPIQPAVTNMTYKGPAPAGFDGTILQGSLHDGSPMYTNLAAGVEMITTSLSEPLKGLTYLYTATPNLSALPLEVRKAWTNNKMSWYTFEINKSATISIYTDGACLNNNLDGYKLETSATPYFVKRRKDNGAVSSNTDMKNRYVKHVDVTQGQTVTVGIPNPTSWTDGNNGKWGHLVTVEFAE